MNNSVSFEYAALSYLNLYFDGDEKICSFLNSDDWDERLNGISQAMKNYRIARNLEKKYDINSGKGLKRFEPILNIIENPNYSQVTENALRSIFPEVLSEIEEQYHKHLVSLTSKILWMKHQIPIIIFDKNVYYALYGSTPSQQADYFEFYDKWKNLFDKYKSTVQAAADKLPDVIIFSKFSEKSESDIRNINHKEWFLQRVFDTFLWNQGNDERVLNGA